MLPPPRTLRRRHRVARRRRPPRRHGEERLRRKRLRRTRPLHPESRPTARAGYSSPPPFPRPPHDLRIGRGSTGNLLTSCRPRKSVAPTNNRDKPSAGPAAPIILLITAANPLTRRVPPRRREVANECVGRRVMATRRGG